MTLFTLDMLIKRTVTVKRTEPTEVLIPDLQYSQLIPSTIKISNRQLSVQVSLGSVTIKFSPSYFALAKHINLADYFRVIATSRSSDSKILITNRTKTDQQTDVEITYQNSRGILIHEASYGEQDMTKCLESLKGYQVTQLRIGLGEGERLKGIRLTCVYPGLYEDLVLYNLTESDFMKIKIDPKYQLNLHFFEFSTLYPAKTINLLCYGFMN